MSQRQHKCARSECPRLCPTKNKFCGPECLAASKAPAETFVVKGQNATLSRVVDERVKTLADLVRVCEIDTKEWEVVSYECNKWEMGAVLRGKNTPDQITVTELYQIKAKLKRLTALTFVREEIAQMKVDAGTEGFAAPRKVVIDRPDTGYMLEIAIPDVHMGKLAWKPETGQDYDSEIAERDFEEALEGLLSRTSGWQFDKVLFVVGNDLLHTDNPNGTTTRGTPQDTDGRFHRTFWKTRKMITRAVERLREIAPMVYVLLVPGNHDTQTLWHLGDSLECWYRESEDVVIENSPRQRKYFEHGSVMLMFCHGDKGKKQDYPLLMATEEPGMFGRTRHREAHTGHIHQLQVQETHGVRVRVSPALCAADAWHAEHAFVGNARAAEAFVWHEEQGLTNQATWTVKEAA